MIYKNIFEAKFIKRLNRFVAEISINNQVHLCHVKNTGRCEELFIEGRTVFVEKTFNQNRKTNYSLISIFKEDKLINIDSQIPNYVVEESLNKLEDFKDVLYIKREVKYKNSRFDIYFERKGGIKGFIEVKGVTLEENGVVKFPDAPSERAIKHLDELMFAKKENYDAYVLFLVQMKNVKYFTPNKSTHLEFAQTLEKAANNGIKILAYDCDITPNSIFLKNKVKIQL